MQFRCIICTNWTIEDQEQDDDVRETGGAPLEKVGDTQEKIQWTTILDLHQSGTFKVISHNRNS